MNNLFINLKITQITNPVVTCDGEVVNLQRGKNGVFSCRYTTEKSGVELCVSNTLEVLGARWFLTEMLFFVCSLFGILSFGTLLSYKCVRYSAFIQLNEHTNVTIGFKKFIDGNIAVAMSCDCPVEERANNYFIDETAKSRIKKLRTVKIITGASVAVLTILILVLYFVFR